MQRSISSKLYLVILVVYHLGDEGLGLGRPGLRTGLAGGGPVTRPAARRLVAAAQKLKRSLSVGPWTWSLIRKCCTFLKAC